MSNLTPAGAFAAAANSLKQVFREYDIRGVFGEQINLSFTKSLGAALAQKLKAQNIRRCSVGYDARLSSPLLHNALIFGLQSAGVQAVSLGLVPTPVGYFSCAHMGYAANVMITASHNPKEFNGFKITINNQSFFGDELAALGDLVLAQMHKFDEKIEHINYESIDALGVYVDFLLAEFAHLKRARVRVAIDTAGGAACEAARVLLSRLQLPFVQLNERFDGEFRAHEPDPTEEANLAALKAVISSDEAYETALAAQTAGRPNGSYGTNFCMQQMAFADEPPGGGKAVTGNFSSCGEEPPGGRKAVTGNFSSCYEASVGEAATAPKLAFAFDGDADRIVVLLPNRVLKGDELCYLFAQQLRGQKLLCEVKCSALLQREISKIACIKMGKTGHANIKAAMRNEGIQMAAELSGHVFFADKYYGYDDAIYAMLRTIELLLSGVDFARELGRLPAVFSSDEGKIAVREEDKFALAKEFEEFIKSCSDDDLAGLSSARIICIDGIRAELADGFFLLRASNTSAFLITRFEATSAARLEQIEAFVMENIKQIINKRIKNRS